MIVLFSLALATEPTMSAVHGWQGDTHFVVETREASYGQLIDEDEEQVSPELIYGDRYDLWGARHRTLIRQSRYDEASLPGPTNEAGWAAWLSKQTFENSAPNRTLSDEIALAVRSPEEGAWEGGDWSHHGSEEGNITLGVQHTSGGWWPVVTRPFSMTAWGYPSQTIRVFPSPSGRWLAVYIETSGVFTMRGATLASSEWTLHQVRPLVSVLAPAGQSAHAEAVVTDLRKPGNGLLQTGTAQTERETTTVYFTPEFESDAQRMARSFGRDIPVEPMSWDGPQDIVIALGPPAADE